MMQLIIGVPVVILIGIGMVGVKFISDGELTLKDLKYCDYISLPANILKLSFVYLGYLLVSIVMILFICLFLYFAYLTGELIIESLG